jgi:hypothetical protein
MAHALLMEAMLVRPDVKRDSLIGQKGPLLCIIEVCMSS